MKQIKVLILASFIALFTGCGGGGGGSSDTGGDPISSSNSITLGDTTIPLLPGDIVSTLPGDITTIRRPVNNEMNTGFILYTYDANGNLITEQRTWTSQDGTKHTEIYTYDTNGNLIELLITVLNTDGSHGTSHKTYTYDANGNLITEQYNNISPDGLLYSGNTTFTYDANGNLIKKESMSNYPNDTWEKYTAFYDVEGILIDEIYEYGAS